MKIITTLEEARIAVDELERNNAELLALNHKLVKFQEAVTLAVSKNGSISSGDLGLLVVELTFPDAPKG